MEIKNQNSSSDSINRGFPNIVAEKNDLFFNVMPQTKGGSTVQPKISEEKIEQVLYQEPSFFTKYKFFVIFGAFALILAPVLYFLMGYLGKNSYPSEDLLVKNPPTKTEQSSASTTIDTETFQTEQVWRDKYFPQCQQKSICGDESDPDHDGLTNLEESKSTTDPNNADSDQDGLSDGDEAHVFLSDPLNSHTADPKYSDLDFIKGGYDLKTNKLMTEVQLKQLSEKMRSLGLHQTTTVSLGDILNTLYHFSDQAESGTSTASTTQQTTGPDLTGIDTSFPAQQERDSKRLNTIKNIEAGLLKYKEDKKTFPVTVDFLQMYNQVKPYIKIATDSVDPINQPPYVYAYLSKDGSDFTLSFYSEVGKQLIKKTSADALKDLAADQAAIYDNQRQVDLEDLRSALLVYSQKFAAGNQDYVFPSKDKYKTALVPEFISAIPRDPLTGQDYDYQVSANFDAFTLKATLQSPPPGNTGYICNQIDECKFY